MYDCDKLVWIFLCDKYYFYPLFKWIFEIALIDFSKNKGLKALNCEPFKFKSIFIWLNRFIVW